MGVSFWAWNSVNLINMYGYLVATGTSSIVIVITMKWSSSSLIYMLCLIYCLVFIFWEDFSEPVYMQILGAFEVRKYCPQSVLLCPNDSVHHRSDLIFPYSGALFQYNLRTGMRLCDPCCICPVLAGGSRQTKLLSLLYRLCVYPGSLHHSGSLVLANFLCTNIGFCSP